MTHWLPGTSGRVSSTGAGAVSAPGCPDGAGASGKAVLPAGAPASLSATGALSGTVPFGISGILCLLGALYFFLGATAQAAALVGGVLLGLAVLGFWLIRRGPKSWLGRQVTLHLRSTAAQGYTGNADRKDLV